VARKTFSLSVGIEDTYDDHEIMKKIVLISVFALLLQTKTFAQASIEERDGEYYEVEYSETVYKPAPGMCGFMDTMHANMGRYRREHRKYSQWYHGKLLRTWRDTTDVFEDCLQP
jgi:hypothetical protein